MQTTNVKDFQARMMVKVPDVIVVNVLKRMKEGGILEEVAKEFNVPPMTIRTWCRKVGITVPSRIRNWKTIKLALGIT